MAINKYYDSDCNLGVLDGKTVAVIGFGSQGHAHSENLAESGVNVVVGLRKGSAHWEKASEFAATHENFKVMEVEEAAKAGDVVMMLVPDELCADIYNTQVAPYMTEGKALAFAHGFNIHFKTITPPKNVDVIMIAPKGPGHIVRRLYTEGEGCPSLICVEQDYTGKAKEIALNHAGVKAADAIFVKAGLDWDDGRTEYEVEFYAGNTEYDYSIDATTGAIRSYDHDWDDFSLWNPGNNAANPSTPGTSTNNLISEAKAKEIALAKAPSGASVVRCHLDWDDGRYIYEIKMVSGTMEYECDINAATGVITDWDVDSIYD